LQPDVAYIMDDMMKDVINRGTATDAQAWGFKNVAGKTAFAGKTGTSRDGWFAGFTPDLVCVVYVGFDDGDDLGMKGSDSALPIWADFMREALNRHPEWNGDWQMPSSIQKAEIDTRDGKILRELDGKQAEIVQAQQKTQKNNSNSKTVQTVLPETERGLSVNIVPPEFRRVEMFITGTIPVSLVPTETAQTEIEIAPSQTPTPFTTWQEAQQDAKRQESEPETSAEDDIPAAPKIEQKITLMICPISEMRATINCPTKVPKTFTQGEVPKEFCPVHSRSPK
jgi:penicillin-binding protein 1B